MNKFQISLVLLTIVLFLVGCEDAAPGSEETRPEAVTAKVFVDENVNGRFDPNEPTIPDTLIVAQHNVHGDFTRTAALTGADGTIEMSADYTHFFEVAAVPPCGYEATTAVNLSATEADEDGVLAFGFKPEEADLGIADIQVHLWQDDYEDGAMGDDERPLIGTNVHFNPDITWTDRADHYDGLLSAQTDENGMALTSFGNSCGIVWVAPQTEGRFTKIRPTAIYDEGRVGFDYADGLLDVLMGITDNEIKSEPASVQVNQFKFANGSPDHPEGFGEWQLLLDRGGYFILKHLGQDEEKDYGVTTLLPAENERLWQLTESANLLNLPSASGEAVPDTVMYTFTLISGDDEQTIEIWSTDVQDNDAVQALLDGITEVIKSHTGEEIVIR